MEKFAILSVSPQQSAGSASVFGRPVIDHLVAGLERSGVRRFLITGDMPATDAARIVDRIKVRGLGASYHRSLAELDALLPAEARLILVAGDAWLSPEAIARLQQYEKAVLVTERHGWERLDRDHHWAGAAVFARRSVSASADLPDSWDVASTLLRQLAQDGARRVEVDENEDFDAPVRIDSGEMAQKVEREALGAGGSGHWFDRLLTRPIAGLLLTLMRSRPQFRAPLTYLPVALAALSAIAASLGFLRGSIAIALVALVLERTLTRIDPNRREGSTLSWRSVATFSLTVIAVILLSRQDGLGLIESATLALAAGLCASSKPARPWNMIVPVPPVTASILLILSFALGVKAVAITSLVCLAALVGERWADSRAGGTGLKRN